MQEPVQLPNPEICKTSLDKLGFWECRVDDPCLCRFVFTFGDATFCYHLNRNDYATREE